MKATIIPCAAALVLAGLLVAGCGSNDGPTVPTNPVLVTETFTGRLAQGEAGIHQIVTQQFGTTTITVVSLEPNNTIIIGIGIGTPDGEDCLLQAQNDVVTQGNILPTNTDIGAFCVAILDVGNITAEQPIDYILDVEHP